MPLQGSRFLAAAADGLEAEHGLPLRDSKKRTAGSDSMPRPDGNSECQLRSSHATRRTPMTIRCTASAALEEEVARVYPTDAIKSPVHLSIGQEAVSVGVCERCEPRGHRLRHLPRPRPVSGQGRRPEGDGRRAVRQGHRLHEGQGRLDAPHRPRGRRDGHLRRRRARRSPTPSAMPTPCKTRRATTVVVVSFFGDGATEEGVFAESLNFAALKKLPMLFVCENNGYAIHTHQARAAGQARHPRPRRGLRRAPPSASTATTCVGLANRSREVVAKLRAGEGPWFFEVKTYRWREHVGPGSDYQPRLPRRTEAEPWVDARPGAATRRRTADPRTRRRDRSGSRSRNRRSVRVRRSQPLPGRGRTHDGHLSGGRGCTLDMPETRDRTAASATGSRQARQRRAERTLSFVDAVREATDQEMARDPIRDRVRPGRGRSQGDPGHDPRPAGEIRPRARLRHAAVRRRDDRRRHRHGPGRDCGRSTSTSAWTS